MNANLKILSTTTGRVVPVKIVRTTKCFVWVKEEGKSYSFKFNKKNRNCLDSWELNLIN